jgi:SSS family solute:Na+ symporter
VEQPSFGAVNTSVLVAYLLLVTLLAVVLAGRQKDTRTYFLAGGRMPWLAVSLSLSASLLSALSYLGAPALAYEENASFVLGPVILLMTAPLVILLFFPIY